jgi:hypothetical protein
MNGDGERAFVQNPQGNRCRGDRAVSFGRGRGSLGGSGHQFTVHAEHASRSGRQHHDINRTFQSSTPPDIIRPLCGAYIVQAEEKYRWLR